MYTIRCETSPVDLNVHTTNVADIDVARPNRVLQVVSYDAPEVVVWAKENNDKFDPTAKLVLYGGVVDAYSTYELLWTQVM